MDEILIAKVKEHEAIYNSRSPDYRDQQIRQTAWEAIGKELNMPANKAKEHWDKLRRCFCNARNRHRDGSKKSLTSRRKSFWKYEQQMEFLIPFMESRKIHGNLHMTRGPVGMTIEPEVILSEESDAEEIASLQLEREQMKLRIENERDIQSNESTGDEVTSDDTGNSRKHFEAPEILHYKIEQESHAYQQILKENSLLRQCKYEDKSPDPKPFRTISLLETLDDTDMFFLSMSRMTKQLPRADQAHIKLALSNSVLSAEIRNQQK